MTEKVNDIPTQYGSTAEAFKAIEEKRILLVAEELEVIRKSMTGGTPLDMLHAANAMKKMDQKSGSGRQTYTFDSNSGTIGNGYKESPTQITDNFLRAMARTPLIRSVIDTRQNQLSNFSRPTMDVNMPGWTIRKKVGLFDKAISDVGELTNQEKAEISGLVKFILNCGITDEYGDKNINKHARFIRPTFESFLRETVRDSLTMDNLAFECISNKRGDLHGFVSVDGATVRFADESKYFDSDGNIKKEYEMYGQHPMYVQIYNQAPVAQFYSWEMCLGIRNKSTDISLNGYGVSELEDLVKTVTWMLNADSYNGKFFSQGAAPKGILKVVGNVNQDRLNEFRMYWRQMVAGVDNAWRTPVLESDKVEWIDLQKTNQDMQFAAWIEYLVRIICAVFKIDPTEIGFTFSNGGNGVGGDVRMSHKQRTDYSQDKGLVPIMRFYEEIINRWIVMRLTDKYEFAWTGISVDDEAASLDLDVKKVSNYMTIDEIREKRKLPPLPNGAGKIVLNAVYAQIYMASLQGNPESNAVVDEESKNPFKSEGKNDNPFNEEGDAFKGINDWIKAGMPATLEKVRK